MNLLKRLFKKRELIPFNFGQKDCPELNVVQMTFGWGEVL